jgi:hypothetical protein
MQTVFVRFFFLLLILPTKTFSQEVIDIVDPYEMKISRSAEADTFYFSQKKQPELKIENQKQDTLRTYDVYLEERITPFGIAYMCNGSEIPKQKYLDYKLFWDAAGACQPCVLYTYNDKKQLKHIAYQYENCLCGSYKEYYTDEGTLKVEGQFMQNTEQSWNNIISKGICNKRDGKWTYYTPEGDVQKIETYVNGKLSDSTMNTIPNKELKTTSENKGFKKNIKKKPQENNTSKE